MKHINLKYQIDGENEPKKLFDAIFSVGNVVYNLEFFNCSKLQFDEIQYRDGELFFNLESNDVRLSKMRKGIDITIKNISEDDDLRLSNSQLEYLELRVLSCAMFKVGLINWI